MKIKYLIPLILIFALFSPQSWAPFPEKTELEKREIAKKLAEEAAASGGASSLKPPVADRRIGGGGVDRHGAPLVSPGLPCNDIKDEKNFVICFSAKIIEKLPNWVAEGQITDVQSKWLEKNLKQLLEQAQIAGKLRDYKYIFQLVKAKALKDGVFAEKSAIGPKIGTIVVIFVIEQLHESLKTNTISIGKLNPDEDELIAFAKDYLGVHLRSEVVKPEPGRGRDRPERPGDGGGGWRPPIVDRPPRGGEVYPTLLLYSTRLRFQVPRA